MTIATREARAEGMVSNLVLCGDGHGMNGLPGSYMKWFMKELGHEGLDKMLAAYEDKSAQLCRGVSHAGSCFMSESSKPCCQRELSWCAKTEMPGIMRLHASCVPR